MRWLIAGLFGLVLAGAPVASAAHEGCGQFPIVEVGPTLYLGVWEGPGCAGASAIVYPGWCTASVKGGHFELPGVTVVLMSYNYPCDWAVGVVLES